MSFSPWMRGRISSPLEAGPSIVDGHHLPGPVNEALEYVSKRLGRKAPHITLLVVRRDYQLPTSPLASPASAPAQVAVSAANTPSRPTFPVSSRIEALKQLVRPNNSGEEQIRERIVHVQLDGLRNGTVSPAFSEASTFSASTTSSVSTADSTVSHRVRWPGSPTAYGSAPMTPATPFTVMSSLSGMGGAASPYGAPNSSQFGMKLVYAHPLSPREEKCLIQALEKAAKKFKLDPSWLPQAVSPSTLGLPADLVLKSTAQNETLFTSEHLTLLSLDHLYTFRTALQAYVRTKTTCRREDAVDELRRLFLVNGRQALRKSVLLAAYRWLDPVNDDALADICRMYERAYGGSERESGVENDVNSVPAWPLPESNRNSDDVEQSLAKRMAMPVPGSLSLDDVSPLQQPETQIEEPILSLTEAIEKEILASADLISDNQSELDAIEAWYREMQSQSDAAVVEIHPLRSHPAETNTVVEILPPPSSPPPPPPITATFKDRPWHQPEEPSLAEMRRTTPKLRPAPPRRALALKLQTTFDKPAKKDSKKQHAAQQQPHNQTEIPPEQPKEQEEEDEEEEELTARPHSAIKSFANARWTATNSGMGNNVSINEMLHGGGGQPQPRRGDSDGDDGRQPPPQQTEDSAERVGPMTPNGYDDISPITRGEWGFLMFGKKGRTAGVGMC